MVDLSSFNAEMALSGNGNDDNEIGCWAFVSFVVFLICSSSSKADFLA